MLPSATSGQNITLCVAAGPWPQLSRPRWLWRRMQRGCGSCRPPHCGAAARWLPTRCSWQPALRRKTRPVRCASMSSVVPRASVSVPCHPKHQHSPRSQLLCRSNTPSGSRRLCWPSVGSPRSTMCEGMYDKQTVPIFLNRAPYGLKFTSFRPQPTQNARRSDLNPAACRALSAKIT